MLNGAFLALQGPSGENLAWTLTYFFNKASIFSKRSSMALSLCLAASSVQAVSPWLSLVRGKGQGTDWKLYPLWKQNMH